MIALPLFSILYLQEAHADSSQDEIVAADLLTVREPKSEAESRLWVIRLTTRDGSTGYGDYLDYGLPAEDAEEALARLVNRYALQNYKPNIFMPDPSPEPSEKSNNHCSRLPQRSKFIWRFWSSFQRNGLRIRKPYQVIWRRLRKHVTVSLTPVTTRMP
jgi:hypothetical protein